MKRIKDAIIDLLVDTGLERGTGKNAKMSNLSMIFCFADIDSLICIKLCLDTYSSLSYSMINF